MMIKDLIQEFRQQNGKLPARIDHYEEDQNCLWHCHHMANIQEVCHSPELPRQRNGYILSEACAGRSFAHNPNETLRAIIFEQFTNSPEHKEIILMDSLACAYYMDFAHHFIYVTIRGW